MCNGDTVPVILMLRQLLQSEIYISRELKTDRNVICFSSIVELNACQCPSRSRAMQQSILGSLPSTAAHSTTREVPRAHSALLPASRHAAACTFRGSTAAFTTGQLIQGELQRTSADWILAQLHQSITLLVHLQTRDAKNPHIIIPQHGRTQLLVHIHAAFAGKNI